MKDGFKIYQNLDSYLQLLETLSMFRSEFDIVH